MKTTVAFLLLYRLSRLQRVALIADAGAQSRKPVDKMRVRRQPHNPNEGKARKLSGQRSTASAHEVHR
jgi:hypothetical protein